MKYRIKQSEKGSISIEAAVIMPVFLGTLLIFVSIVQIISAEQILCSAAVKAADKMCKWAPIYKNFVADELKDDILNRVSGIFKEDLDDESGDFLAGILQIRNITENSFDYIYAFTMQTLCDKYIKEDPLIKNNIIKISNLNLYKSRFFYLDSNNINIRAVCNVTTYLPFEVNVRTNINCAAWGKGVAPHISTETTQKDENSTQSIWEKDNFYRGKVIRQMYGANLPENFPVIAIFGNGMATMIKSINHTAETYSDFRVFERTIKRMIDEMYSFEGASFAGIDIKKNTILQKRIILVCPENEFTELQTKTIENLMRYATSKLIVLDLRRYQKI